MHLLAAAVLGGTAVALGAFGAHALAGVLSERMAAVWETAVRYQFLHALALLALSARPGGAWTSPWCAWACRAWVTGVVLFSGSLYLLALTGVRWIGFVTPFGGLAFLIGWASLVVAAWQSGRSSRP